MLELFLNLGDEGFRDERAFVCESLAFVRLLVVDCPGEGVEDRFEDLELGKLLVVVLSVLKSGEQGADKSLQGEWERSGTELGAVPVFSGLATLGEDLAAVGCERIELCRLLDDFRGCWQRVDEGHTFKVLLAEGFSDMVGVALVVLDRAVLSVEQEVGLR